MNRTQTFAIFAAVTGLAVSAPISAAQPGTKRVAYDDLDLSRQADARTFRQRIDKAIIAVCGPRLTGDSVRNQAVIACRAQTRAAIEPRIARIMAKGSPRQTALSIKATKR